MDKALSGNHLLLHYQPQIDILSGRLLGVEALVRLDSPDLGFVYPDQFVGVAESHKMMARLTESVLITVCQDIQKYRAEFDGLVISVNLSSQDIESLNFPERIGSILAEYQVPPNQMCLELTETEVMGELTNCLDVLNRLRMKGFHLSIDDFGTGFSSLIQLYNAPFTELKVDRHFVMKMVTDPDAQVIVDICIMLGKKLGMKVVAEGVESKEIQHKLAELHCDIAQGYGIARPQSIQALIEWKLQYSSGNT